MLLVNDILRKGLLAIGLCLMLNAAAQEPVRDLLLEDIVEDSEADFDFDTWMEWLNGLKDEPMNLNSASTGELSALMMLNDQQVMALQEHIRRSGPLLTIYELQAVPHFDLNTIANILPYVTVAPLGATRYPLPGPGKMLADGRHQLFLRHQRQFEDRSGYLIPDTVDRQRYLGSPDRLYMRYRFNYRNRVSAGITAEKDPGEEFFRGSQPYGFDFYSAHVYLEDIGPIRALALGDYSLQFGQGLSMWTGFGFNKSPYPLNVKRGGIALRPFTSVNEVMFLRGAAMRYAPVSNIVITVFGSHKGLDANVATLDTVDSAVREVSSLQITGLHRTPSEVANKSAISESIGGAAIEWANNWLNAGVVAHHTRLSAPLNLPDRPYNRFRFQGDRLSNASAFYTALWRGILAFGEVAVSSSGGVASLHGATFNLDGSTAISIVHRHYSRDYQVMYSNAFGEQASTGNESGVYIGMSVRPLPKISLNGYVDLYKHQWMRFAVDGPSHGHEWLGQLTWTPRWGTEAYLRARHETKYRNATGSSETMNTLVPIARTEYRFHISRPVNREITLRSRVVHSRYREGDKPLSSGYLVYQDVHYRPERFPVSFATRFALFSTSDFNSRIYAYESDMLYQFSIPAYYDEGSRWYVLLHWRASRTFDAWFRIAQIRFPFQETIGSGLDLVEGNTRTEIKAQVRVRW